MSVLSGKKVNSKCLTSKYSSFSFNNNVRVNETMAIHDNGHSADCDCSAIGIFHFKNFIVLYCMTQNKEIKDQPKNVRKKSAR